MLHTPLAGLRGDVLVPLGITTFFIAGSTDFEKESDRLRRRQRENIQKFSTYFSSLSKSSAETRKLLLDLTRITCQLQDAQPARQSIEDDFNRSEQEVSVQEELCVRLSKDTKSAKIEAREWLERASTMVNRRFEIINFAEEL